MTRDPTRYWWVKLVLVALCMAGVWSFEYVLFPLNSGLIGATVGLVVGAFVATVFEDYMDQNSD
ncbi:MAG: hypothetical protein KIS73_13375 [Enhydrobacter sp.]|nr:hypothetical protein [Enhydrobacter sp.]